MHTSVKTIRLSVLAAGISLAFAASANPQGQDVSQAPGEFNNPNLMGAYSLIDLPPVVPVARNRVLVAQVGAVSGLVFDPTQVSPLGNPAWVASLRGPDPMKPSITIDQNFQGALGRVRAAEPDRLQLGVAQGGDAAVRNGQVLANGKVFLIGAERSTLSSGRTITLGPGKAAELGDIRVPFVRVYVSAPSGKPLDVDALVGKRPQIGMFSALFVPAASRSSNTGGTAIATVTVPAKNSGVSAPLEIRLATVEDRSVVLRPVPAAAVEERIVVAKSVPVEDHSNTIAAIPPASVEERLVLAFAAPVEDKSAATTGIPLAQVEERLVMAFAAPVEEKSGVEIGRAHV